jgi:hypothetical protein
MIGTAAGVGIGLQIVRNADVAHLRMEQSVDHFSIHQCSAADPGAHSEVENIRNTAPCAPTRFAGSSGVDVGVEADRYVEFALQGSGQIEILPVGLGCGRDKAEG